MVNQFKEPDSSVLYHYLHLWIVFYGSLLCLLKSPEVFFATLFERGSVPLSLKKDLSEKTFVSQDRLSSHDWLTVIRSSLVQDSALDGICNPTAQESQE